MGHPQRFQLPLINETIEGVDAIIYDDNFFGEVESSVTVGIGSSLRSGLSALVLTTSATTGTPNGYREINLGEIPQRIIVEVSCYIDFTTPTDPTSGFMELLGIYDASNVTGLYVAINSDGRIVTSLNSVAQTSSVGYWSTLTDQSYNGSETRFRLDIDQQNDQVTTYHYTGGSWQQTNQQTLNSGEDDNQKIRFSLRCSQSILSEGGTKTVEYRKLVVNYGDSASLQTVEWSDLLASGQLRGAKHSATTGKIDQNFMVRYVPELYGTPSGTVHAEVQIDTDSAFGSPVYAVVACDSADDYVAVISRLGLDPLTAYYWRIRFTDGGTYTNATTAITGGTTLLTTDSLTFETMSAPGGSPGTLRITWGNCTHHADEFTPNGVTPHERIADNIPHLFVQPDDITYETGMNGLATSSTETAGAARIASYLLRHETVHWWHGAWVRIASRCPVIAFDYNHVADSNYPGIAATPTNQSLVDDCFVGWDRYMRDGMFTTGTKQQDWITFDTARCRIFLANCHNYDNEAGVQGTDGRNLFAATPRMLGVTQLAALVDAVETCDKPIFLLFGSAPFATDAASVDTTLGSWGMATAQRGQVTDAADANSAIKTFLACSGQLHWSFVSKQGLPKSKFLNIGCGPMAQIASNGVTGSTPTAYAAGYDGGPIWSDIIDNGVEQNDLIHRYCEMVIDEAAATVTYAIKDGDGETLTNGVIRPGGPRGRNFRARAGGYVR